MKKFTFPVLPLCAFCVLQAVAADTLFDFETDKERNAVHPQTYAKCVREGASSGSWALRYNPPTWRIGLPEWPSVNIATAITDWSGYDRLVIDIVNYGDAARLAAYIGGKGERVQNGLLPRSVDIPEQGFARWVIELKDWPESAPKDDVRRVHFFMSRPVAVDIRLDRFTLLRPGEPVPEISREFIRSQVERTFSGRLDRFEREYPEMKDRVDEFRRMLAKVEDSEGYDGLFRHLARIITAQRHAETVRKFRQMCVQAGQKAEDGVFFGKATSMEKVRPRSTDIPVPADGFKVRLSRGEYESVQLFVMPDGRDLRDVKVAFSDLRSPCRSSGAEGVFSASNITASVVGYVETMRVAPYTVAKITPCSTNEQGYGRTSCKGEVGWWPDPILDYLDSTDVANGDMQGFWLRFKAPRNQKSGIYRGEVKVSASGSLLRTFPLEVRVNDFDVPEKTPLPMAITFSPGPSMQYATPEQLVENARMKKDALFPGNLWRKEESKWYEFLASYYITVDSLYHRGNGYPKIDALKKLSQEGRLDCFNLGYWGYPKSLSAEDKALWRKSTLGHLKASWAKAKEAGIEKFAYLYGCDEISERYFEHIRWAVSELKKEFPGVPISTTAYDHSFGTTSGLGGIDVFTPLTPKYDVKVAFAARREGRKVWWYICCSPHEPHANMFVESPAIEARVLMGAQTVKYRPDGFLYYQITIWNSPRAISGRSAFTDWVARSWTTYHGDGSWTCCGPGGTPLATVRLENFRDGLEDYAYALILEKKLAENPSASWAAEAAKLLEVPQKVAKDLKNYTYSPAVIYEWRNSMADLIEKAQHRR